MPTITRVSWRPFAIPLRQAFGAAHGTTSVREGVVLRIETDEGYVGLGEASPLPTFVRGTVADVLERLPVHVAELFPGNESYAGDPFASPLACGGFPEDFAAPGALGARCFAMQTALGDILAQQAGLPFFRWFANTREQPLQREVEESPAVPVNAVIGGLSPELAAEQARQLLASGFTTFKVKVGMELDGDIARVLAVRDAIGPGRTLRIDANGGWTFEDAVAALERLSGANVAMLEQPIPAVQGTIDVPDARPAGDFEAFRELGRRFPGVTIAADESLQSLPDQYAWHAFAEDIPLRLGTVLKPMVSGLGEFLCLYQLADVGRPVIVTTTIDAGIATAAAMHVAACLPRPRAACGLSTLDMLEGDIVTGVPPVVNGTVTLPETPGLGVALDDAALERYATGPWEEVRP